MPTLEELAEDTMAYLPPSSMFEPVPGDGCVYVFGREILWVIGIRRIDLGAARAVARTREVPRVDWWLGPSSPPGAAEELLAAGLVPDEVPTLTGMTSTTPPPRVPGIDVPPAGTEEVAETEHAVWGGEARPPREEDPAIQLFAAEIDGRVAGVAHAVDLDGAVALMGGAASSRVRR